MVSSMLREPSPSVPVAPAPLARAGSRRASDGVVELRRQLTRQRTALRSLREIPRPYITWRQALRALNHWGSWLLIVVLVVSQFTCIFWSSQSTDQYMIFGQDPTMGMFHIGGYNDEPYTDRSLVCVRQGRLYRPLQLSAVLASSSLLAMRAQAEIFDTTGQSISGYRVVARQEITLYESVAQRYAIACDMIAATLPVIVETCSKLGYKTVQPGDDLLIVEDVRSNVTHRVFNSLPVLIMPFWDNAIFARYAIPGVDGSACIMGLSGLYDSDAGKRAWLRAANRTVRESHTFQWLRIRENEGVTWRNGWLEDPASGQRWYSAVGSSLRQEGDKYNMRERQFDMITNVEINCDTDVCIPPGLAEWWGEEFYAIDQQKWFNSVAVSNGSRYGLFLYEAAHTSTVYSVYDIAILISNTTVGLLLFRWFAAMVVLFNAYRRGYSRGFATAGIGCLSCTRSFELLPILLLPRMHTVLAAFFTAGCRFEGEQRAISDAWFVIYPALAEVMVYYYSVLNVLAKVLRRRMTDELFGPSLMLLCLLHWCRGPLANSGLFEFDGRISTVMTAKEYERIQLIDFFSTDAALRLNGNVWSIFGAKLVILAVNLMPLALARKTTPQPWVSDDAALTTTPTTMVERALGVRASESPGLGVSLIYHGHRGAVKPNDCDRQRLNCFELVRLGYIVLGDVVVMPVTDWLTLVLFGLLRSNTRVSNYRVLAFRLVLASKPTSAGDDSSVTLELDNRLPTLYQMNDPVLLDVSVWDIAAVPLP